MGFDSVPRACLAQSMLVSKVSTATPLGAMWTSIRTEEQVKLLHTSAWSRGWSYGSKARTWFQAFVTTGVRTGSMRWGGKRFVVWAAVVSSGTLLVMRGLLVEDAAPPNKESWFPSWAV